MAEEQKPIVAVPDVTKEDTTAATDAVHDAAATGTAPALDVSAPSAAEETKTTEAASDAAPKVEDKKEVKPVEEGHLGHKAQGASFPKNLIPSKEFFFFGSDSFDPKALSAYLKNEKHVQTARHNIAWAAHTGKGLLFVGDKKAPSNVINLAEASEPETEGANKFHLTHKGNKHSFKATSATERDSWVAQIKAKIAEAKELATSVTETEGYKNAIESFKPAAAPVKETKALDETPKVEDAAAVEAPATEEAKAEEQDKEETKADEPKSRSTSRKRASIFGGFGKKDSTKEKKEEAKTEEAKVEAATAPEAGEPAAEAVKTEEAPVEGAVAGAAVEDKAVDDKAESPKEKPAPAKRNSIFGNVFSKKEKKALETAKPAEEKATEGEVAVAAEPLEAAAPVIPPVAETTPLAVDVANPTESEAAIPAAVPTNGEAKKDVKERRKSSLPFAFGKREKSPSKSPVAAEGEEKAEKADKPAQSAFSKLRATIKGKSAAKANDKSVEEAVKEEGTKAEGAATEQADASADVAKDTVAPTENAAITAPTDAEDGAEKVVGSTPVVTAAA